jgi:hypothetical protein
MPMRKIKLVNNLRYNKKEEEDGRSSFFIENLEPTVYEAEEVVTVPEVNQFIIENVVNEYKALFAKRNIIPTYEQIKFAETTAKILLGDLKDNKTIPVIPAPCGFGKSTITFVFVKEICNAIRNGLFKQGMIIVTDKLEELKSIHNELEQEIGYYKEGVGISPIPFTYVLEGWTEKSFEDKVCLNSTVKTYTPGMCSKKNCSFFTQCKMASQQTEQHYSPILLMTNARLETFNKSINEYSYYTDKDGGKSPRTMIINDEKPSMFDFLKVSMELINKIDTEIWRIAINNEGDQAEKEKIQEKWGRAKSAIETKLKSYASSYDRFLVSNINNEPILLNDEGFASLWKKHMGKKYSNELKHIHSVLTRGGLFCKPKKKAEEPFINTIGMKDLLNENFKTVIFDATALVDPEYASSQGEAYEHSIRFVDIENARTFENVTFKFFQKHKINKSEFNSKNYLINALAEFIETLPKGKSTYVVTYKEQASKLLSQLKNRNNTLINEGSWGTLKKVEIVTSNEKECFYFGNTKGSNAAKDCIQMAQLGWHVLPDYIYATRYLCTFNKERREKEVFQDCSDVEIADKRTKLLVHGEKHKFEYAPLYLHQHYSMLTDFVQEVFRTKLRDYDYDESIEINCFKIDEMLVSMIKQLFPRCKVVLYQDEINCFKKAKALGRENGKNANTLQAFIDNKWNVGETMTTKEIYKGAGLTDQEFKNLKSKNPLFIEWFKENKVKRGVFIKPS